MRLITSIDLKQWADTKSCHTYLPLIIRDLLSSCCSNIFEKRFPIVDSTYLPGFDGKINVDIENEFLPIGKYVFEMGCNKDIKSKANNDYIKRKENFKSNSENYSQFNPKECVYVFVTPREWRDKDIWSSEKNKENLWKEVQVLDAVDLELWLEKSINVSLFLAKLLGKNYSDSNIELLDVWWDKWSNFTEITINEAVVLASRNDERECFLKFLDEKIFSVQSLSNDESLAFIISVFKSLSDNEYEKYISKAVIVKSLNAYNELIENHKDLILIINFGYDNLNLNTENKLIIISNFNNNFKKSIKLRKQFNLDFKDALLSLGIADNIVKDYTRKSGANLLVLRRILTGLHNPSWINKKNILIPIFLIRSWDNSNIYDKKIIEYLCEKPYEKIIKELNELLYVEDTPLENFGNLWYIRSPFDVFMNISKYIIESDLDILTHILFKIFKEEKYNENNDFHNCSDVLKNGILNTLILIAVFGGSVELNIHNAVSWADKLMKNLFLNESIDFLKNHFSFLNLIAEISPNAYLDFLESNIFNKNYLEYSEEEKIFLSHSMYLLHSLETIVWEEEYFPRVVLLIAKLALFSSNDKFHPNPSESLKEIFLPWYPKTFASLEDRLKMLDKLLIQFPSIGWNLLMDLMPNNRQYSMHISEPLYRKSHANFVNGDELIENYNYIIMKVFKNIGEDLHKWVKFLDFYNYVSSEHRIKINQKLFSLDKSSMDVLAIKDKIRQILSFSKYNSKDILTKKEWDDLKKVYDYLEPSDIINKNIWLFNEPHPRLINANFLETDKLDLARKDAIIFINESRGFGGFKDLANKCRHPYMLGEYLIKSNLNYDNEIIYELENDNENIQKLVQGYIFYLSINDNRLFELIDPNWSKSKIKRFFSYCKPKREIWDLIENYDEDIQIDYWMSNSNWPKIENDEDWEFYIKKLVCAGSFDDAIIYAYQKQNIISVDLILDLLIKADIN